MTPNTARVGTAIEWQQAMQLAHSSATAMTPEWVDLGDAVGRRLVLPVSATHDVPHYESSAMDGWAVRGDGPWAVVQGDLLKENEASAVVTGAPLPPGARAVLRSEYSTMNAGLLVRSSNVGSDEPRDGAHIRLRGEEAHRGDMVIARGTRLNPAHVAVAASCGCDRLAVAAEPRVAILLTGTEVITAGLPGPGQVRDSFGPQLPAFVDMLGGVARPGIRIPDDRSATVAAIAAIAAIAAADVVVTTGGTGRSSADHIRAALIELGAELLIDGIAIRPGGPSVLARLPGGTWVVGLPGNPLAAMVGALTIIRPLLAGLAGLPQPALLQTRMGVAIAGRPGATVLVPYLAIDGRAHPSSWRESGMMRGLASAAGVLAVPESGLRENDDCAALPLPWWPSLT